MIGIIFDCDGTLVDSMGAWHEVDRTLASEAGITLTEADAEAITTMSLPEASAYLHEQCGLGESNEAVLEMIFDRMRAFYANEVEARPGALEFVRALHERGVPMAVASSTPADMLATCVERCGFAPYMKTVVSVDDLQTSKREPAVYDHARSFLGTDRAHTWAFEDAAYALTPCARPATALAPSTTTTSPAPATSSSSAPTSSSPHGRISTPTSFSPRPALKRQNRKIRATAV